MLRRRPVFTLLFASVIAMALALPARALEPEAPPEDSTINDEVVTNKLLKLTDEGLEPEVLELERHGASVFFFNDTSNSLVNLEIDYGNRLSFCATGKMRMGKDGVFRSAEPFAPKAFVAVCFPEPGEYPVTVHGLGSMDTVTGTVIVR